MAEPESYVKFRQTRENADAVSDADIEDLQFLRATLKRMGLIGERAVEAEGDSRMIGFGNVSKRRSADHPEFIISGTMTGGLEAMGPEHYVVVTSFDIFANHVHCRGKTNASAESLTHGAIYLGALSARFVAHIHHKRLWESSFGRIPTTSPEASYGSPEIAVEIARIAASPHNCGAIVMGGHDEGLLFFAENVPHLIGIMGDTFNHYLGWDESQWILSGNSTKNF